MIALDQVLDIFLISKNDFTSNLADYFVHKINAFNLLVAIVRNHLMYNLEGFGFFPERYHDGNIPDM